VQALRIQSENKKLNEREVVQLEQKLEMLLPSDYRDFLISHNGGVPYHNTFDVVQGLERKYLYSFAIRKFLGLNERGHDDLIRTRYSLRHQLPDGFLPIAVDKFRNFMCLALPDGQVYFFDLQNAIRNEWPKKDLPLEMFFYPVAITFSDLIENLYHRSFT
jgi:SMI1-KNR4 cell-wall